MFKQTTRRTNASSADTGNPRTRLRPTISAVYWRILVLWRVREATGAQSVIIDYAGVIWDNCTNSLADELENLLLEGIRIITDLVRGTSHHKLYLESRLLPLRERRRRHKLILYFK
ncbi:hypothetical protein BaRGS_00017976 [Batillaria attramentaria]|uniref:Uncharacterized protein n=1 Tax=Batillaria attramentaria TaxID=370345 RepID=A0ABD0KUH5_9CAEN